MAYFLNYQTKIDRYQKSQRSIREFGDLTYLIDPNGTLLSNLKSMLMKMFKILRTKSFLKAGHINFGFFVNRSFAS